MNLKNKLIILILVIFSLNCMAKIKNDDCKINQIREVEYFVEGPSEGVGLELYGKNGTVYVVERLGIGG